MEEKKLIENEDLEKVTGGSGLSDYISPTKPNFNMGLKTTSDNPFSGLPHVDDNQYSDDVTDRS